MTNTTLTAALIQMQHQAHQPGLSNLVPLIEQAAQQGAQLVVLPELHNSHYFCQIEDPALFDLAEPLNGPTQQQLGELAGTLNIVIVASIFEKRAAGLYHNTAIVLDRSAGLAGFYRKMHIPDDPGYGEKFYFTPGDKGFTPITTSLGKLGVFICWDQWFPETARLMALAGADLLICPTAIGASPLETQQERDYALDAWQTVQRAHAIANGLPMLCCNRSGFEAHPQQADQGTQFWGNSFICGPQGEWLARADTQTNHLVMAEVNYQTTEQVRRIWPFLRDRRIDAYQNLCKRHLSD